MAPAREATNECASSWRRTRTRPGLGASRPITGTRMVPSFQAADPVRRAGRVAEAGRGLQHDGDGQARRESQALLVLLPGAVEDAQHGEAERLVGGAVVADTETGARDRGGGGAQPLELAAHAGLFGGLQGQPVPLAGAGEVPGFRQRIAEELQRTRAARLELEGGAGRVAGPIDVTEGELGGGESLQGGHRARIAEQRETGEAEGLRGVSRGEALPAEAHVGILQGAAVGGLDLRDEGAGHGEHRALAAVAQLLALEPGEVRLDHAAVLQDDGIGAAGPAPASARRIAGSQDPARHDQGSSSPRGATRGVTPPCRKYEGTEERAASAAGRSS